MHSCRFLVIVFLAPALLLESLAQPKPDLLDLSRQRLELRPGEGSLDKFPSTYGGAKLYQGDGQGTSALSSVEAQIRRRMAQGGRKANAERERWIAEALRKPSDPRALFGAMLTSWIWMDQRYQLGDERTAKPEDHDRHGSALLLGLTKTKDPAALRLMLAYELTESRSRPRSLSIDLLAAGRRWNLAFPNHLELRRGLAFQLSTFDEPRFWPEGDRMVSDLARDRPKDLMIQLFPLRVERLRFMITNDPSRGRRALALLSSAQRVVPSGSMLATYRLPSYERSIRSRFKRLGITP